MIDYKKVFEPVRDMIENENYGFDGAYSEQSELRERWYNGELNKDETSVNLRLDWELATDIEDADQQDVAKLMLVQFENDLKDLIVNGDIDNTSDALLKSMNGEKKRQQKAVEVRLLGAHLAKEYKERKASIEYTLYFRPYVRFE